MEVHFGTRQLQQAFEDRSVCERRWGRPAARKYVARVVTLQEAPRFDDVRKLASLRAHRLAGQRRGQWALDLTERVRLIVEVSRDEREVTILEVSQHYGD